MMLVPKRGGYSNCMIMTNFQASANSSLLPRLGNITVLALINGLFVVCLHTQSPSVYFSQVGYLQSFSC